MFVKRLSQSGQVLLILLCVLTAATARAQSNVGSISGAVVDASGASVAACQVTVTNPRTGLTRSVSTQESGIYVFASLPEGTYNVRAGKAGFRQVEQSDVILDAASRRTV
ncbi:MAG: Cna domain protein, partial [Bryobacterales bacterium]|nr:Cna domain protein [Bryobacterales bacterium]